jgi:amino acid transporter
MGKNIESPEKNVGRGIVIVMALSIVFYLVTMLIFFCAIGAADGF